MYLVFGTYISFRISFPANVTCYISSVCWIRRRKDTPTYVCSPREETDFAAIASLCSIPLLSFLSFFIFSLSFSLYLSLVFFSLFIFFVCPSAYPYICFFRPVMALPRHFRLCLRVSEMPATRRVLLQRRRVCCCSEWRQEYEEGETRK